MWNQIHKLENENDFINILSALNVRFMVLGKEDWIMGGGW